MCRKELPIQGLSQHLSKHANEGKPTSECLECSAPVYIKENKFCGHKCAATSSNRKVDRTKFKCGPVKGWNGPQIPAHILRKRREESGDLTHSEKSSTRYFRIVSRNCKVCGEEFKTKSSSKAQCCSKDCRMSIIKNNRGRHKKSYMESSFAVWLDSYRVPYESEVSFKNEDSGKWYFVDFLFEDKKLIIELDGAHHKDTVEHDRERDIFIAGLGYHVLRITHVEYQSKEKLKEVCKLLNIDYLP